MEFGRIKFLCFVNLKEKVWKPQVVMFYEYSCFRCWMVIGGLLVNMILFKSSFVKRRTNINMFEQWKWGSVLSRSRSNQTNWKDRSRQTNWKDIVLKITYLPSWCHFCIKLIPSSRCTWCSNCKVKPAFSPEVVQPKNLILDAEKKDI